MIGIYKIINTINNKVYVGQSTDMKKRWLDHKAKYQYDDKKPYIKP